jgi:O-antigen ligase
VTADLPSRAAAANAGWRRIQADQRQARAAFADRWTALAAAGLLILMVLYVLIGNKPYVHEVALDPLTGATEMSPINRYIWLALGALSVPILWLRRGDLLTAFVRLWPLLLLMAWFALTTRWAIDPGASSRRLLLYGINVVICVAVALGLRDIRRTHAGLAIACAVVVLIDLFSWILMPGRSMTELGLAAIHSHKNTLGAVMLLAAFVCGTYAWGRTTWKQQAFWWAITLFAIVLLAASRSKTSLGIFVAVAAFTPAFVWLLRQRPMTILSLSAVGAVLAAAAAFFYLSAAYTLGMDPIDPVRGVTFTQRTDVWKFVYQQILLHPLQGVGFGSFWDVDPRVQPSLQTDYWFARPDAFTNEAHNGYLDIAVTTGLVGLSGALFLLGRWMLRGVLNMRAAALGASPATLAAATFLGVFPLLMFGHNWMESSYWTANAIFGTIILIVGMDLDLTIRKPTA